MSLECVALLGRGGATQTREDVDGTALVVRRPLHVPGVHATRLEAAGREGSEGLGDIPAHRIVSAARSARDWGRDASLRMAQGAAEYWTEEQPLIASRVKVETFVRGVSELSEGIERLEKRIERLGAPGTSPAPKRSPK